MAVEVINVPEAKRYEARQEGETELAGIAEYIRTAELVAFVHTEVPAKYEGKGVGAALARASLDEARAANLRVLAICPFYTGWIARHPEYQDLLCVNNVRTPFTALDEQSADNRRFLLRHIEVAAQLPTIRRVRRRALEAWDLQDPGRLLDVGSGAGEVVRDLAALVGPAGEVIGVDNSQAAVDFARERADAAVVRYDQGDALALPYPDDHFDGVRCERVLQHVVDPDAAIAEMVRVLRPGGRVCLIDTDWESMLFDGTPQLGEAYRKLAPALPAATSTGRTLRRRLVTAGLADVSAEPVTVAITDYAEAAALMSVVDRAVLQGPLLNLGETAEPWLAEVDRAVADGTLLAVLTIWVVTGTKPAP